MAAADPQTLLPSIFDHSTQENRCQLSCRCAMIRARHAHPGRCGRPTAGLAGGGTSALSPWMPARRERRRARLSERIRAEILAKKPRGEAVVRPSLEFQYRKPSTGFDPANPLRRNTGL